MTNFKPYLMEIPDGYRTDDLSNAYADAAELGLWIKEWGGTPNGRTMTAVGSYYLLQKWEHENPDEPELDPSEFSFGQCVEISMPGVGDTRVESILNGIHAFKESSLWAEHEAWHKQASEEP